MSENDCFHGSNQVQSTLFKSRTLIGGDILLEIYFGEYKCRNFGTFRQNAHKIISGLYVNYPWFSRKTPNFISAEYFLRRT